MQYDSIGASYLKEQDLKRMRTRVKEWRQLINAESARPPTWYESLFVLFDNKIEENPEVVMVMT